MKAAETREPFLGHRLWENETESQSTYFGVIQHQPPGSRVDDTPPYSKVVTQNFSRFSATRASIQNDGGENN